VASCYKLCSIYLTTYASNAFEQGLVYIGEDVGFWVAEDLESNSTVMILKRRDIVVAYREIGACVDLVTDNKRSNIIIQIIRLQSQLTLRTCGPCVGKL